MGTSDGYVYILTNPNFKEDWIKIGKSSRPVDVRSKKLGNIAFSKSECAVILQIIRPYI